MYDRTSVAHTTDVSRGQGPGSLPVERGGQTLSKRATPTRAEAGARTAAQKNGRSPARAEVDPDRLVRHPGGSYRTADERFVVEQSNGMWFLADERNADELGLPRVTGPFPTLRAVRDAIPAARDAPASIRPPTTKASRPARKPAAQPAPKPETWLDRLTAADRRRAERTIAALERVGFADAEGVAQGVLAGRPPADLARRLLEADVAAALEEEGADDAARAVVARVLRTVTGKGKPPTSDLPGWALVETEPDGAPTERRIALD